MESIKRRQISVDHYVNSGETGMPRHSVIKFQHCRKISPVLFRDTVGPSTDHTTPRSCSVRVSNHRKIGVAMSIPLDFQRPSEQRWSMNASKYSCAAIREAWEREAKQRWDSRTHGRGLSLLKMLALPGSLVPSTPRSPTFEFWRDQNKIRGRFIGAEMFAQ